MKKTGSELQLQNSVQLLLNPQWDNCLNTSWDLEDPNFKLLFSTPRIETRWLMNENHEKESWFWRMSLLNFKRSDSTTKEKHCLRLSTHLMMNPTSTSHQMILKCWPLITQTQKTWVQDWVFPMTWEQLLDKIETWLLLLSSLLPFSNFTKRSLKMWLSVWINLMKI